MAPVSEGREGGDRDQLINISFSFLTDTWLGRLKIVELVLTLICGACAASIVSYGACVSHFGFLDFVAWTAFINLLIDLFIRILGLWERLYWIFRHPALMLLLCGVACVGFLIGGSLAASCAKRPKVGDQLSTAGAAAAFAFFSLGAFAVDAFIHFQKYRSMEAEAKRQSSEGRDGDGTPDDNNVI